MAIQSAHDTELGRLTGSTTSMYEVDYESINWYFNAALTYIES